jgi:hypothetical protein
MGGLLPKKDDYKKTAKKDKSSIGGIRKDANSWMRKKRTKLQPGDARHFF